MQKSSGLAATIVALLIGLLLGFGGAKLLNNSDSNSSGSKSSSSAVSFQNATGTTPGTAAELQKNLVTLGVAHMHLTQQAVDAALDGSPNAAALKDSLVGNGTQLSKAVGSVYGNDAQTKFQNIWNNHLNDFVKYAVAAKGGDTAGKQAALADIDANYTKPISQLLSGANPNLKQETLEAGFRDHIQMTARMIDAHAAGDFPTEEKERDGAVDHITGLMSTLSGAIAKQYPDKFKI